MDVTTWECFGDTVEQKKSRNAYKHKVRKCKGASERNNYSNGNHSLASTDNITTCCNNGNMLIQSTDAGFVKRRERARAATYGI